MKEKSRLQYITINSVISVTIYFLKLFFMFINRSIFIYILGIKVLGITNLVMSVIGFLGLAEFGIGASITYSLYKPIAENDIAKRNAYLKLYKIVYRYIAVVILFFGILVFPFLRFFTLENIFSYNFYSVYFLILLNSVIGYITASYKRSLLDAKQQKYVFLIYDFLIYAVFSIIKWISLYLTGNYTIYLFLNILSTILSNLFISYIVDKNNDLYKEISIITNEEKEVLKKNVFGGFVSKFASFVVFSTDNLLISKFFGTTSIGLYGNYTLIVNNLNIIISQITNSHTSTLGNLISKENNDRVLSVFKKYNFINYIVACFSSLMVLFLISPFIKFWLGAKFVLSNEMSYLVSIYLFLSGYRNSFLVFIGGYGLYWKQKKKSILESVSNIFLSIIFVKNFNMGMEGILLGTICSLLFVNIIYEPYILYKHGFNKPINDFIFIFLKQIVIYFVLFIFVINFKVNINSFYDFIYYTLGMSFLILFILFIVYFKSEECIYLISILKKLISNILGGL